MKRIIWSLAVLIVLSGVAYWIYTEKGSTNTIQGELTDFSVKDTAAIDRIFMADDQGNTILLERGEEDWILNEKYKARPDGIRILLETIHKVRVKSPVSQPAMENVLKDIMGNHTKIEIYQGGSQPVKTYFVGSANQLHTGTHMLIDGSSRPFITHIEGFHGFLTTRYFTNENEWRDREVFAYQYGDIKSVSINYLDTPENNFKIVDKGDHETFDFFAGPNLEPVQAVNDVAVKGYLANYKLIHFEGFEETKPMSFIDSVMSNVPMFELELEQWDGETREVIGYRKPLKEGYDPEGNPIDYDLDRLYLYIDGEQFVVGQYTIFDQLTFRSRDFISG